MLVLVHCSITTLEREHDKHPNLGVLVSPRSKPHTLDPERLSQWRWAADNDCFQGLDESAYRRMLSLIYGIRGCLFVTAPDVVGDSARTLELFDEWYDELVAVWQPLALVAQDGLTVEQVPWARIDALFIGGTDTFKLSTDAHRLVLEAKARQKWVHMGRVNGGRRIKTAKSWGVDSIDGTSVSRFRKTKLPLRLSQAAEPRQLPLDLT